jgi:protein-L-isoaspartate(D-aspartate) O-methyltransferase
MMRLAAVLLLLALNAIVSSAQDWEKERRAMVENQIAARGIRDTRVLQTMGAVPRHLFVPADLRVQSYQDSPLPIGEGQTNSQPYIVALMTELLRLTGGERVLEIGTGSGYQAAILSRLVKAVYTIEIRKTLFERAAALLASLGCANTTAINADGYYGYESAAPFDAIMITAAVNHIPPPLLKQLKDGGRMVLPLGNPFSYQELVLITRKGPTTQIEHITGVLFVPLTGAGSEGER